MTLLALSPSWSGDWMSILSAILLDTTLKATAILLAATGADMLLRRASAATRHLIWTAALAGVLLLPALSWTLPAWRVLPRMPQVPTTDRGTSAALFELPHQPFAELSSQPSPVPPQPQRPASAASVQPPFLTPLGSIDFEHMDISQTE